MVDKKILITFVDFDPINNTDTFDSQLIDCLPRGRLVGVNLQRLEGEENALDTPTFTLRIYEDIQNNMDWVLVDVDWDGTTIAEDYPISANKNTVDVVYESYDYRNNSGAGDPQMFAEVITDGLNNVVVADFLFRLRIETEQGD